MSLTIYEGLRATANDPFEVARQVRAILEPMFHAKFKSAYEKAKENKGSLWSEVFFGASESTIPELYRMDLDLYQIVKNLHSSPQHTFSDLDFGYDVLLYKNAAGGNPLILVFGEKARDYRQLLITAGAAEDYGYWDNADEDEDVSAEDWATRKLAWSDFGDISTGNNSLMILIPDSIETSVKLFRPTI
jgi:hypothetical protein